MSCKIRIEWVLLACIATFPLGCSSKNPNAPAKVSGKVTMNGAPVTAGTISFTSKDQGSVSTGIKSDGTYEATDLPVGELVVTVETETANPDRKQESYQGQRDDPSGGKYGSSGKKSGGAKAAESKSPAEFSPAPKNAPQVQQGAYVKIPARYSDPSQSKLSVTLTKGSNTKNIELTD